MIEDSNPLFYPFCGLRVFVKWKNVYERAKCGLVVRKISDLIYTSQRTKHLEEKETEITLGERKITDNRTVFGVIQMS